MTTRRQALEGLSHLVPSVLLSISGLAGVDADGAGNTGAIEVRNASVEHRNRGSATARPLVVWSVDAGVSEVRAAPAAFGIDGTSSTRSAAAANAFRNAAVHTLAALGASRE